jgi:hypothetical protein
MQVQLDNLVEVGVVVAAFVHQPETVLLIFSKLADAACRARGLRFLLGGGSLKHMVQSRLKTMTALVRCSLVWYERSFKPSWQPRSGPARHIVWSFACW